MSEGPRGGPATTGRSATRILQIVNLLTAEDGGPARHAYELGEALTRAGHDVCTLVWSGQQADSLASRPHRVVYAFAGRSFVSRVRMLRQAVDASDVIIVHGHYLISSATTVLIARTLRRPYLLVPHGVFTSYQRHFSIRRKYIFDILIGNHMLRWSSSVIAASVSEMEHLPVPLTSARVLGIGTDIFITREKNQDRPPPTSDAVRLLSLSRLTAKKRLDISIRVAAELARLGLVTVLQIAGTGEPAFVDTLLSMSSDPSVAHPNLTIEWLGLVDAEDKYTALRTAHFFLLPSDDENFGIGIIEALANGLPVISSAAAAASSLVLSPGRAGAVLSTPNPKVIAQHIKSILQTDEAWPELSRNALDNAIAGASWPEVARLWSELVDETITPKPI